MLHDGFDVSFSGLKTAVVNYVRKHPAVSTQDVAASFQTAVVDVLVAKSMKAAQHIGAKTIALGGGVAANSLLREKMTAVCAQAGWRLVLPSMAMCTDNAAGIGSGGGWGLVGVGGGGGCDRLEWWVLAGVYVLLSQGCDGGVMVGCVVVTRLL